MLQHLMSALLYGFSLVLGFFMVGLIVPKRELVNEAEEAALEELINFPYKYIEDLENEPDIELSEEELLALKDKTIEMEIPLLSNKVVMFYDHECETFKYYSSSDLIHKFLNVVCRKYVLDNQCKQIYKFDTLSTLTPHEAKPVDGPFMQKAGRATLGKNINKFLRLGTLEDMKKSEELKPAVEIGVLEFMKMTSSLDQDPPSHAS